MHAWFVGRQHDLNVYDCKKPKRMPEEDLLRLLQDVEGVGPRYEMLVKLLRREKAANILPDYDLDVYMKVEKLVLINASLYAEGNGLAELPRVLAYAGKRIPFHFHYSSAALSLCLHPLRLLPQLTSPSTTDPSVPIQTGESYQQTDAAFLDSKGIHTVMMVLLLRQQS